MADVAWTANELRRNVTPTVRTPIITDRYLIPNNGRTFLRVVKGTNPCNVTIEVPGTLDGVALTDRVEVVPASSTRYLGPFPPNIYGDTLAALFSEVTGISVEVLFVP